MDDSAHAVDETKMDVAMMEGGPEVMDEGVSMASAPSVALSGEAKMGLKRVDDNASTDPESDNIKTVVEYEVEFSSSGVTDGGLVFGAAISIDEDGKGAGTANGVNEASVYVGGANGSWKLQFGDNDPGVDLVGNIGLADADEMSGKTEIISPVMLGGEQARLPARADAWEVSITVKYDENEIDSVTFTGSVPDPIPNSWIPISTRRASTATESNGTGTLSFSAADHDIPDRTAIGLSGKIGSLEYRLTTGEDGDDAWSLGTRYAMGAIKVGLGVDSNDVMAASLEGSFAGNTISGTYVRQSGENYTGFAVTEDDDVYAATLSANAWTAMGIKFKRDFGSEASFAVAYSRRSDQRTRGSGYPPYDSRKIELDFEYGLGGGAKFYAGIEKLDVDDRAVNITTNADGEIVTGTLYIDGKRKLSTTTIEMGISMSF